MTLKETSLLGCGGMARHFASRCLEGRFAQRVSLPVRS